jgi:hypothetical protein
MLRRAISNALLILAVGCATVLLVSAFLSGASIMYIGAGIGALVGIVVAIGYLVVTRDSWGLRSLGLAALVINIGIFGWLWLELPV